MKCELRVGRKRQLSCSSLLETSCSESSLTPMERFKGQSTRRQTHTSGHSSAAIIGIYWASARTEVRHNRRLIDAQSAPPPGGGPVRLTSSPTIFSHLHKSNTEPVCSTVCSWIPERKQLRLRTSCNLIKAAAGGDVHIPAPQLMLHQPWSGRSVALIPHLRSGSCDLRQFQRVN